MTTLYGPINATVNAPTAVSLVDLGATPAIPAVPPLVGVASGFMAVLVLGAHAVGHTTLDENPAGTVGDRPER